MSNSEDFKGILFCIADVNVESFTLFGFYLIFWHLLWTYRAAATALAKRHANGFLPVEDFNIELEDQSGQKVNFGSETDQR